MSVSAAVHTAIFSTLQTALAGKAAVIAGRLDAGQTWPAVHVGDISVSSNDGINTLRSLRTVQLTVFSDFPGPVEAMNLIGDIKTALHNGRMTIDDGHVILSKVARETTQLDADGMTYTGTVWVEVRTTP